jgi:hypothetical protein
MVMKFTNNAATTLAGAINSSVTSLSVSSGAGALFPTLGGSDYFYCTLTNTLGAVEIIKVTARSVDNFTIVRGQDGTTAASWSLGDKVELRLVAASLNDIPKLDEANTFSGANTFSSGNTFSADQTFSSTGAIQIPGGTTAQRPTGAVGKIRWNSDLSQYEAWNGTIWGGIGGAQAGGAIQVNNTTASVSYTIATGSNGLSVGPITLASGVSVTVASGQRWVII